MVWSHILTYLKTHRNLSRDERRRIRHQYKRYVIIDDTLYRRGAEPLDRR